MKSVFQSVIAILRFNNADLGKFCDLQIQNCCHLGSGQRRKPEALTILDRWPLRAILRDIAVLPGVLGRQRRAPVGVLLAGHLASVQGGQAAWLHGPEKAPDPAASARGCGLVDHDWGEWRQSRRSKNSSTNFSHSYLAIYADIRGYNCRDICHHIRYCRRLRWRPV